MTSRLEHPGYHGRTRRVILAAIALSLAACAGQEGRSDSAVAREGSDTSRVVGQPAEDTADATGPAQGETATATPAPDTVPTLGPDGWGPLRIGMTRDEVVAAAGEDANPGAVGGPDPEACDEFRPERAPRGMLVMIERGRLTRISVARDSDVKSDRGIGLGDPASAVTDAYGAAATKLPHKYVATPAAYYTVWRDTSASSARGVRYEIGANGRVSFIRGGGRSIEYVEGCL